MRKRTWIATLVVAALMAGTTAAGTISFDLGGAQELNKFLNVDKDGGPIDYTGVRAKSLIPDLVNFTGERLVGDPVQTGQNVQQGFLLLDDTLEVHANKRVFDPSGRRDLRIPIRVGNIRVRYRMGYDPAGIRKLELGKRGLKRLGIRMMRLDLRDNTWKRAVRVLGLRASGREGRVGIRFLRGRETNFTLGHHGHNPVDHYVWAVMDRTSSYAVGVSTAPLSSVVPVPAAALLGIPGLLLVLVAARRRRAARA